MPFRAQTLDTGFTAYQAPKVDPVPTERSGGLFQLADNWKEIQKDFGVVTAAFRLENDVVAGIDLLTRPVYEPDPTFDVVSALKTDGLWEDYSDNFLGVGSKAEYDAVAGRIAQEQKDRLTLSAADMEGMAAAMFAGLVSPTVLLPFVGQARGARAVGIGIGAGLAGGAAQELPLQFAQETRTGMESVSSIAMSTVLGGVLGGAVAFARAKPSELAKLIDELDTDGTHGGQAISIPRVQSVGAASARQPLALASAMGLEHNVGQISPVVRGLTSRFEQARWMMAQLADAGLEFAGKVAAAVGGNVENRIKTWYGPADKVLRGFDDAYARYHYGVGANKPLAVQRANLAGMNPNRTKLSRKEFKTEVGRAMQAGDQHSIPEVAEMAAMIRKEIYEPMFERAKEVGIYKAAKEGAETLGDVSYLNRVYNTEAIQARQAKFEEILASHYETKLVDEFRADFNKLQTRANKDAERVADFARSPDEIKQLREDFENQLRGLDSDRDAELVELEAAVFDKQSAARSFGRGTPERKMANAEARALVDEGGEALAEVRARRAEIRRRLTNLRRAQSAIAERHAKKLDKIDRAEELNFNTLRSFLRKGQKIVAQFDTMTDEVLDAEISKLKNTFADSAARFDRNEERVAKIFDDEFEGDVPTSPFVQAAKIESDTFDKMTAVAEAIEDAELLDRAAMRDAVQAMLDEATRRTQGIVERRAVRNARLAEQAKALDPEAAAARVAEINEGIGTRQKSFTESWRERGADDIDPATGAANFKGYAKEMANTTTRKILGTHMRLPGIDMILEPKGAELARVLDIDSRLLRDDDGLDFLEMDSEKLMMMYVRTLGPDIELTRAFGDDFLGKGMGDGQATLNENWLKLADEAEATKQFVIEQMKAGKNPETGKPKTYTQEQIDKRALELSKEFSNLQRDMQAVIGRMRHTWGVPADPRGFGARAAKIASNVNVLRYMSNVTISSIPDIARPVMKYGLLKTFKHGYIPFIKGLGKLQLSARQLRLAGGALDVTLHSRAAQVYDVGDYMVRGSKFEKGLEYATSKIGVVALFDYWTTAMKQIAGSTANAMAMDSLRIVAGGAKASAKDLEEATRFLAANGIDDSYARRIWKQVENGGGEDVNGVMWANTEDWVDPEAVTAFNAMLVREVDNTIITPGVERPLIMDSNLGTRLLFQFKSFGASSTTKTFLAGAQSMRQGDMAFVQGGLISLAMGTLSYYIYAQIAGGTVKDEMETALAEGNWQRFADEAINRSGLLGIGADAQAAFASTPLAKFTTFDGERFSRRGGDPLYEELIGPTYGDLLPRVANIAAGAAGAIVKQTPGEVPFGDLRRLMPLQNMTILRKLYDQIEEGAKAYFPESDE